jgi:1-acyl-sn-glycerol-3-phosphate acyltransferase
VIRSAYVFGGTTGQQVRSLDMKQPSEAALPFEPAGALQCLRSKLFDLLLALWTSLFGIAIPILWLFGSPKAAIRVATRLWVRGALLGLRYIVDLRHVERGREHILTEPCLIVANHQSTWETLASLVLFPDVAIVAKRELLTIPVFGWYLRRSPMIVIAREEGPKALREMIQQSKTALSEGRSVLIFPEGTRRPVDERVELKRGAELLYTKLGVPVLTMAHNSGRYWSPGAICKRGGTIVVSYGARIPAGLSGAEFTKRAEATLEAEKNGTSG